MARAVATVGVSVVARTKNFRKGMKRAQTRLQKFSASVVSVGGRLAKFGAVLGGVAAGAMAVMIKRSFKAIDVNTKLADSIGISTEALTGLQHAAELTGVGTEGMNKSLERFTRVLGEAVGGTGEAKDSLDILGLSASDLVNKAPDKAFGIVADAINNLGTQAEKADVAYGLFGRQGVKLLNTLKLGSKGLAETAEEAQLLGLSFSRIEGAKIEMANDAITRLKGGIIGMANTAATKFAPVVTAIADGLVEWVKHSGGARVIMGDIFKVAARGAGEFMRVIDIVSSAIDGIRGVLSSFVSVTLMGFAAIVKGAEKLANAIPGLDVGTGSSEAIGNLAEGFAQTSREAFDSASESMANAIAGTQVQETLDWFENLEVQATKAAEAIAEAANPNVKVGFFDSFVGGVQKFVGQARVLGDKAGEAMQQSFKDKALAALGLGPGGLLKNLVGELGKTPQTASAGAAASFREVDFTKVAIGSGKKSKPQKTEEVNSKDMLEIAKETLTAIKGGIVGVLAT